MPSLYDSKAKEFETGLDVTGESMVAKGITLPLGDMPGNQFDHDFDMDFPMPECYDDSDMLAPPMSDRRYAGSV